MIAKAQISFITPGSSCFSIFLVDSNTLHTESRAGKELLLFSFNVLGTGKAGLETTRVKTAGSKCVLNGMSHGSLWWSCTLLSYHNNSVVRWNKFNRLVLICNNLFITQKYHGRLFLTCTWRIEHLIKICTDHCTSH